MASATVGVRLVRCPKCDKLLTEFHQVPVYRCGGCGTVLRAKARASTEEATVRGSVERDSQSPAESSSSKVEQPDHRVLTENLPERGNQVSEEEESSSYPCRVDDDASGCLEDDIRFTSLAYDNASESSRDEQPLSRRRFGHEKASDTLERDTTFGSDDFHSVQNWMGSEIGDNDLIALSKDLLLRRRNATAKAGYSEPDDLKILRKVDELRDELREFLTKKTSEAKRGSHFLSRPCDVRCRSDTPPRVPKVPTRGAAKRYFRPVCGGAPFVVCYKCWELLHLPADFLVSGKTTLHKLRCGACSEVLVFSFRARFRADPPRTPAEARHPPSEVDHRDDGDGSRSEPDEPVQDVSRSSSYSTRRRDWQRANASRLHRLMGYSSASDMLFEGDGRRRADGGNDSSETSTPQFYRPPPRLPRRYGGQGGTGASTSKSPEVQQAEAEEEESSSSSSRERAAAVPRRRGSSALGLLKKGVRELSHGLENVKLKVHSRG